MYRGSHLENHLSKSRRRKVLQKFRNGILFILSGIILISALFYVPSFRVTNVLSLADDRYKKEIDNILDEYFFGIIPKRSLIIPKKEIRESLISMFPDIRHVDIARPDFSSLVVEPIFWQANADYCSNQKCFKINENGKIFATSTNQSAKLLIIGEKTGVLNENVLSPEQFSKISNFITLLKKLEFNIHQVTLKNDYVEMNSDENVNILWDGKFSAEDTFENLESAMLQIEDLATKRDQLQYIDTRFEDRIYYRLR